MMFNNKLMEEYLVSALEIKKPRNSHGFLCVCGLLHDLKIEFPKMLRL